MGQHPVSQHPVNTAKAKFSSRGTFCPCLQQDRASHNGQALHVTVHALSSPHLPPDADGIAGVGG